MKSVFRCSAPVSRTLGGINVRSRCRRCGACMEMRRYHWQCRSVWETMHSDKTCFVTLTFGRAARASIFSRAAIADKSKRNSSQRLFDAAGTTITQYVRDLRELDARYLFVPEPHANGFPHYHALVHVSDLVRLEQLSSPWDRGYGAWKWVRDRGAITYVTKYLAKGRHGRIRASLKYGGPDRFGPANRERSELDLCLLESERDTTLSIPHSRNGTSGVHPDYPSVRT